MGLLFFLLSALCLGTPGQRLSILTPDRSSLPAALTMWNLTASSEIPRRRATPRAVMPWRSMSTMRHSAGVSTSSWRGLPRERRVMAAK